MQSCSDFNKTKFITLEEIYSRYEPIGFLGEGMFGIVVKVLDKQESQILALKIGLNSREIRIACDLQKIRDQTDSIVQILNMAAINKHLDYDKITNNFIEGETELIDYIMTMPVYQEYYNPRKEYPNIDDMGIYFEICVALKAIHKAGYYHGDIKTLGNIMLQKVDYKRIYTINNNQYEINNYLMPVIIDLGLANFTTKKIIPDATESMASDDFYYLYNTYFRKSIPDIDLQWLREYILLTPLFNKFKQVTVLPGEKFKMFAPVHYELRSLAENATKDQMNAYNYGLGYEYYKNYHEFLMNQSSDQRL